MRIVLWKIITILVFASIVSLSSSLKIIKQKSIRFDWKLEHDCVPSNENRFQRAFRLKILHNNVIVHDTGVVESKQTSYTTIPNVIPPNQLYEYRVKTYFGKIVKAKRKRNDFCIVRRSL